MSPHYTHSLGQRLSLWLALQTLAGLAAICVVVYVAIALGLQLRQTRALEEKAAQVQHLLAEMSSADGTVSLPHRLDDFMVGHKDMFLTLRRPDGRVFYERTLPSGEPNRVAPLAVSVGNHGQVALTGQLTLSTGDDRALLTRIAAVLAMASLIGAALISAGGYLLVRQGLRPVRSLEEQTRRMTPQSLHQRLQLDHPPLELAPLVTQFNALLERLEQAYEQLESFNADVAHELFTPLATLISGTEIALRRDRDARALRDTLGGNLEELQRVASIVQDMLFLSRADRGALARRGAATSLYALAHRVASYHEAALADAGLAIAIRGDHLGTFDQLLVERALSNLLSNASRYARVNTQVEVDIEAEGENVSVCVTNWGDTISAEHLPLMFRRFYRADPSRTDASNHHGLGLAIVSAVARMHGGSPIAQSAAGRTTVGWVMPIQGPTQRLDGEVDETRQLA